MIKDILGNPQSKRRYNQNLFRVVAPVYDRITGLLSWGRDSAWKKTLGTYLPGSVHVALDVACGTGDITQILRDRYPLSTVIGLDLTFPMLQQARRRLVRPSPPALFCADMCATGLPDASVEVITGSYALRNAPDLSVALTEFNRILKPEGVALFLDFSKSTNPVMQRMQLALLKLWGSLWGFLMHRESSVYAYIAHSLHAFPNRVELIELLGRTGFMLVDSRTFFTGYVQLIICRKK